MANKRSRGGGVAGEFKSFLVDDVAEANNASQEEVARRTKYIKRELDNMTEEQLTRFEFFVRSHLSRTRVRDLLAANPVLGKQGVTDDIAIVVGGLAKLFVGELMDQATEVMRERRQSAEGVQPEHLEEAYRRLQLQGKIGSRALADRAFLFSAQSHATQDDLVPWEEEVGVEVGAGEGEGKGEGAGVGSIYSSS